MTTTESVVEDVLATQPKDKDLLKLAEAVTTDGLLSLALCLEIMNADAKAQQIEKDVVSYQMQKYRLLKTWKQQSGQTGTIGALFRLLHEASPSVTVKWRSIAEHLNFSIEDILALQMQQSENEQSENANTDTDGSSLSSKLENKRYRPPKTACIFDGRLLKLDKRDVCDLEKNCTVHVGSGSTGEVYTSKSKLNGFELRVVVKKIFLREGNATAIRREKNASRIMHPFILPLLAVEDRPNGKQEVWFVSPYCENGDLNNAIKIDHAALGRESVKMNNVTRVKILLQIASAIEYIHTSVKDVRKAILHKDLASQNVVLDARYNARLIDFGLAREKSDQTTKASGREAYAKHVVNKGKAKATESSDYYAYGVVIREMLTGLRPEGPEESEETYRYLGCMEAAEILTTLQKYVWPEKATPNERKLNSIAHECLQAEKWNVSDFKTKVVEKIKDILTRYNGKILDIPGDYKRCHICIINPQATESSMTQEHGKKCRLKIKVCVACERNSFLNPITCYCGVELKPNIGQRWGALLVAGNDENDTTLAAAFTKDMQEMKHLITSKAPLIMGIPEEKVCIVIPENPDNQRDGKEPEMIVSKVEEKLRYFSNETEVDTLLIYFSCHGEKEDKNGSDRFQFGSASDCMSHDDFKKKLETLKHMRLIIFLDCCYPPLIELSTCEGFIQINACKSDKKALSRHNNGMFTKYLIQGLKAKSEGKKCPDNCEFCKAYWGNGSDFISLQSLFEYVNNHLKDEAPEPNWQGRSWKNIAFYSDESVEIEFTSKEDGKTKSVPLGYILNIHQLREKLRQQFGKDKKVTVSIQKDTYRKDVQFINCDTLEKVMSAWVHRLPLHVTFGESTNHS